MKKEAKLSKWGNSISVRIPKFYLDFLGLSIDDLVNIELKGRKIIITRKGEK